VPNERAPIATDDLNPEDLVGAAWDPDGLLPPPTSSLSGGHFARRQREREARLQAANAAPTAPTTATTAQSQPPPNPFASQLFPDLPPIQPIAPELLAAGGILANATHLYDRPALEARLLQSFIPIDLDYPGLRIQHLDPFVATLDNYWTPQQCDTFIADAEASGQLQASKVGAGNVYNDTINAINSRRTSTSVLVDPAMEAAFPPLADGARQLRAPAWRLLGAGDAGEGWGSTGKLPRPGQYCYESLQITRYQQGQYFLAHEDAFPVRQAATNGFQRHATLLVYLNAVAAGGATRFDHLGVALAPRRGSALLFFPAFADGRPDSRTLHTAMDAVDTKWVVQQWVARGYQPQAAAASVPGAQVPAGAQQQGASGARGIGKAGGVEGAQPARKRKGIPFKLSKKKGFGG
jgi:hypothetical protein